MIFGKDYPLDELEFEEGGLESFITRFYEPIAPTVLSDKSELAFTYILLQVSVHYLLIFKKQQLL